MPGKSDSMSSFEHVQLEDVSLSEDTEQENPSPSATRAAAKPADDLPASGDAAGSTADAAETAPDAAAAGGAAAAAAVSEAPEAPPATQALASVLGFLGSGDNSTGSGDAAKQPTAAAAKPAAAGVAAASEGEEGYDAVAAFEAEALEAADKVAHAAEEVGHKLLHGAAEAKESLASLAQGITSWWANLDPVKPSGEAGTSSSSKSGGGGGGGTAAAPDEAAAAEQLGLEAGETVLESFACQLWQTYTATNNFYTPVRMVPFPGSLHVTTQRLCFVFEDRAVASIRLGGKTIGAVTKRAADAQLGLPERIELSLEAKWQSLVLADFSLQQLELDSALALLEHLAEQQ